MGCTALLPPQAFTDFVAGCIRLHPEDIADLFGRVPIGTPGDIIYTLLILARLTNDRICLKCIAMCLNARAIR